LILAKACPPDLVVAQNLKELHHAAYAAVGAGDDVFGASDFSKRDDAIGYEFRVLDEFRGSFR
jgi:hypothetical protein